LKLFATKINTILINKLAAGYHRCLVRIKSYVM